MMTLNIVHVAFDIADPVSLGSERPILACGGCRDPHVWFIEWGV
jgi:hypothetical protein